MTTALIAAASTAISTAPSNAASPPSLPVLAAPWIGPYGGVPAFDKASPAGLAPAMEAGMARQLVEAGVTLVQVNLGKNETWDTHENNFPLLRDCLLPPTDRGISALLDDLKTRGLLDNTLVVMCGEMGRTPKVNSGMSESKVPGRDHWGAVHTVFIAGGGTRGGVVVGSSDKNGAYPSDNPQRPEQLAATIYHALGIPATAAWKDELDRPHHIYQGEPIAGLL